MYNTVQKRQASGRDLLLPKEIIFVLGAPGSGKGTHSARIMEQRGITAEPIVMSNLLISPESKVGPLSLLRLSCD